MKIQLARLESLSEESEESVRDRTARSRRIVPTPWWLSQNLQQREQHIQSHPNSKFRHILHVGLDEAGNPATNPNSAAAQANRRDDIQQRAAARAARRREREKKEAEEAEAAHGTETVAQRSARLDVALAQSSWRKGAAKLASKGTMFAGKLSRNLTPNHEAAIENFFKEKFAPKPEGSDEAPADDDTPADGGHVDSDKVIAAVKPLARVLLAGAILGLTLAGGGIIVAALAAAYTNGNFTLPEFFTAESSSLDTSDPVQFLVHDFTRWAKTVDMRKVSTTIAEIIAVQKEIEAKKGLTPDRSPESDQMVSESAAKSLRIVPCPSHKKNNTPITRYLVKLGTLQVGRIHSDPKISGDSPSNRCWVSTMNDGFEETAYRTGVTREAPFTLATRKGVLLRNPQRQTLNEAKAWVRATVNKDLL